ncbi:hypothetical protein BU24DRAFT_123758 [Aaosphaeria arxii CBS 175.79]|uniref:Uncharacterized protein n=1 Tax=Aaosphaeria arxii CBS 175.79 TaxID=1450172 RepID=A0A6A5Y300_9PLEO|nr:uncharacterized protein BU24DRAFT_123758 [Aaosphaeria arxii CBS 175.79]KAF2019613.1 hypothetical protein BU24DRAFT_123758 [Aaosphaeria arxii CBS 175.79]
MEEFPHHGERLGLRWTLIQPRKSISKVRCGQNENKIDAATMAWWWQRGTPQNIVQKFHEEKTKRCATRLRQLCRSMSTSLAIILPMQNRPAKTFQIPRSRSRAKGIKILPCRGSMACGECSSRNECRQRSYEIDQQKHFRSLGLARELRDQKIPGFHTM